MTIKVKELAALKTDLENAKKAVFASEGPSVKKIEDLPESRRHIFNILDIVLDRLIQAKADEKLPERSLLPAEYYPKAFYGLINIVRTQIANTRWSSSTLDQILRTVIEDRDAEDNIPSIEQTAEFAISINKILEIVFKDNNSRFGIQAEHPLHEIPTAQLNEFLNLGYKIELDAQIKRIDAFCLNKIDDKADPTAYKVKTDHPVPESALKYLGSQANWNTLHSAINDLYCAQTGKKGGNIETFTAKNPVRASQLQFLFDLQRILKNSKQLADKDKTAILAGSMYLIRAMISTEYKLTDPKNSVIYRTLGEMLNVDLTPHQEQEALLTAANRYIRFISMAADKRAFRTQSEFSKFPKFDLEGSLRSFQILIFTHRTEALKEAIDAFTKVHSISKAENAHANDSSWASWRGIGIFGKPADETKEPDQTLQTETSVVPASQL